MLSMTTKMIKVSFRVITVQVLCFLFNFFIENTSCGYLYRSHFQR